MRETVRQMKAILVDGPTEILCWRLGAIGLGWSMWVLFPIIGIFEVKPHPVTIALYVVVLKFQTLCVLTLISELWGRRG